MPTQENTNKVALYIATHNKTGLKYFGKTTRYLKEEELQSKYHGSGTYWKNHLKKHGDDVTMKIYGIYNIDEVKEIALKFSKDNNIVEDCNKWANQIPEDGLGDGVIYHSKHTKKKISNTKMKILPNGKTRAELSGEKSRETQLKKDNNGLNIYQKNGYKAYNTMIKNGTLKERNNKISKKLRQENEDGLSKSEVRLKNISDRKKYYKDNNTTAMKEASKKTVITKSLKSRKFRLFNESGIFQRELLLKELPLISQSLIKTSNNNRLGSNNYSKSRLIKSGNEKYIGYYVEEII